MKKLKISLLIIMVLLGCAFTGKCYAAISGNVNLTASKTEVAAGEEFSVEVKISNLSTSDGIIALGAVLDYDKTALTFVDVEGVGKWSAPLYNSENGKLVSTRNALTTSDEVVFKVIFKVNENAGNSAEVKISDFTISGGDEEKNIGGNSITVKIKTASLPNPPSIDDDQDEDTEGDNNQADNVGGNTNNGTQGGTTTNKPNTNNSNSSSSTTNKNSKIPQLGLENNVIITLLAIAIACVAVFGTKLLVINKKIKKNK